MYSFKKHHDTTVVCYLDTADPLFARKCSKDCCHIQHPAAKFNILFVLAWTFARSWLIRLFAHELAIPLSGPILPPLPLI